MDPDEERSLSLGTEVSASVPPPSPLTGCYLLAIIGEPHTHEHKEIILQRLVKGLLSWDSNEHQVDLESELATLTAQAPEGEEARYGERLIQFASESLVTEILIHPQMNTLMQCMRNLLSSFTRHRHLVHAGYTFAGNGSWIMQDGTFSLADFTDAYQENEVQRVIRAYENSISIDVHCSTSGGGEWAKLPEMPFVKHCKIRVNPTDILDTGSQAIKDFIAYLDPYIVPASLDRLLESSDVVGNIRFSHPTLYVFPGGQGDAALFGINGFNMLVDGGFSRKACWWDFARHLDRLDAVLLTRLNNCSAAGMAAVLRRKALAPVYPQIGHFFCNLEERRALASPDGDKDSDPLLVSLLQEGSDMMADLRHLNLKPQQCYRSPEPINLYHKVGHGTLDMYVLNPSKDSKHVREFLKKWHNSEQKLFEGANVSGAFNFPIPNLISICALLVWRPANPDDTITRIMFPGSTPQHKIFEGLEKLKHLEFLQHPTCTGRQMALTAPQAATTTKTVKTTKTTVTKEKIDKTKEDRIVEPEPPPKKDETDSKNVIDNKLLSELTDGEDKKIESVLQEAITGRVETKLDDKIAHYESTVIDSLPKKKEVKKKDKVTEKKKRIDKTDEKEVKEVKRESKQEITKTERKKTEVRRSEVTSATTTRTKLSHRTATQKVEKKTSTLLDKKLGEDKKSPPTTPKKISEVKSTISNIQPVVKERVKTKTRKLSPGSTPAKSTKEAANRRVMESKFKQPSPKRDLTQKATDKPKVKREPISRRPRPLASPVKGLKAMKSPTKSVKAVKVDSKLKGLQRVNYEDILKDAKKSDEDTSKSLDDIKLQELDDREEQEIVREIEAVFNRDSEADEKVEYVGRSDIEKITCHIDDAKTEAMADGEFEEEYLIIEKEEVDQYTEDSIVDREAGPDREDELQKHVKDKEESEKKKEELIERLEKTKEEKLHADLGTVEIKQESKDHSVSVEEKQDISSEKKTSDSKNGAVKPKDSLDLNVVQESQPDEKISTTIESGATTAPTLPEDERITLDDIKEDQQVEEKHAKEETKEIIPPQTLIDVKAKSPKLEAIPAPLREIVKTPDEVADLPLHEEVDYRTYEEKKTPVEEDVFKRKPDVGFIHEIKVPKDLPLLDAEGVSSYKSSQHDVVLKTVERPSHAELVTVTPGSAPESPMYPEAPKVPAIKELEPVKEYDDEFNYSQYTEKLRETHITTLDSPIKDEIIIVEEIVADKIPVIPEDIENEIDEDKKIETTDRPPLSPKYVEDIVLDVAKVLKSDLSLEEIMAEKSPIKLQRSPEHLFKTDMVISAIESTKKMLSSETELKDIHDVQKDTPAKGVVKEISPSRSLASEDISEVSDKTVLSEGKRVKRELRENGQDHIESIIKTESELSAVVDETVKETTTTDKATERIYDTQNIITTTATGITKKTDKITEEAETLHKHEKSEKSETFQIQGEKVKHDEEIKNKVTTESKIEESRHESMTALSIDQKDGQSSEFHIGDTISDGTSEKRLSVSQDTAKTLEKLEERMADLKKKEEAISQKILFDNKRRDADLYDVESSSTKEISKTQKSEAKLETKDEKTIDETDFSSYQETKKLHDEMMTTEKENINQAKLDYSKDKKYEDFGLSKSVYENGVSPVQEQITADVSNKKLSSEEEISATKSVEMHKKSVDKTITIDKTSKTSHDLLSKVPTEEPSSEKDDHTTSQGYIKPEDLFAKVGSSYKVAAEIVLSDEVDILEDDKKTRVDVHEESRTLSINEGVQNGHRNEKLTLEKEHSPLSVKESKLVLDKEKDDDIYEDDNKSTTRSKTAINEISNQVLERTDELIEKKILTMAHTSDKLDTKPVSIEKEIEPKVPIDGEKEIKKMAVKDVSHSLKYEGEIDVTEKRVKETKFDKSISLKDKVPSMKEEIQPLSKKAPSERAPSLVPSDKAPSPVPSDKAPSPVPSDKFASEKATSPTLSEKAPSEGAPSLVPSDKAPSPVPSDKAPSPVPSDKVTSEKAPSPTLSEKAPSERVPSPVPSDKAPSPVPSDKVTSEKAPSPTLSEKAPSERAPSLVPSDKAPSPVPSDKAPSPVPSDKVTLEKPPSPTRSEKAPSERVPSPVPSDKAPVPVPSDKVTSEKAPSPTLSEKAPSERAPSLVPSDKAPSSVPSDKAPILELSEKFTLEKAASPTLSEKASPEIPVSFKQAPFEKSSHIGVFTETSSFVKNEFAHQKQFESISEPGSPDLVDEDNVVSKIEENLLSSKLYKLETTHGTLVTLGKESHESISQQFDPSEVSKLSTISEVHKNEPVTPPVSPETKKEDDKQTSSISNIKITAELTASSEMHDKAFLDNLLSEKNLIPIPSENAASDKAPSPAPSEKAPSPVLPEKAPSEQEPSPTQSDKVSSEKAPSLIPSEKPHFEKAPSPAPSDKAPSEKAPSPTPSDKLLHEKVPSPVPSDKAPSPVPSEKTSSEKAPSPVPSEKAPSDMAPSPAPSEKTPSDKAPSEKALIPTPSDKMTSEKAPSLTPLDKLLHEKVPIPVPSDKAPSPVPSEKTSSEKAPSPVPSEKGPSEKASSLTPSDKLLTEKVPSPVLSEKAPSPVPSEKTPSEKAPSPVPSEKAPSDKAPSPVPSKKTPSDKTSSEKAPGPTPSDQMPSDKAPSPIPSEKAPPEKAPSSVASDKAPSEKAPSPTPSDKLLHEKAPSPVPSEKTPSDKALSPVPSEKTSSDKITSVKLPSPTPSDKMPSDKAPSPIPSEKAPLEKAPSPVPSDKGPSERAPSPTPPDKMPSEKAPSPIPSEKTPSEKAPSPVPSDKARSEKAPSPTPSDKLPSEQAPSPVTTEKAPLQKAPSPTSSDKQAAEKADSPIPSKKALSPVLLEKAPSEKAPSPTPSDKFISEKAPSPVTSAKAASPTLSEKAPSEKAPSPLPSDKLPVVKAPSPVPHETASPEKADSSVPSEKVLSEKAPSPVPSYKAPSEKALRPTPSDKLPAEKAMGLVPSDKAPSEKGPSPTLADKLISEKAQVTSEKTPSPVSSDKVPSEKAPSPTLSDKLVSEKVPSPVPFEKTWSEKTSSPLTSEKGPSDGVSSRVTSDKAPSDKAPSPAPSDKAPSEKAPSPTPSDNLPAEKPPLLENLLSEKVTSKAISITDTATDVDDEFKFTDRSVVDVLVSEKRGASQLIKEKSILDSFNMSEDTVKGQGDELVLEKSISSVAADKPKSLPLTEVFTTTSRDLETDESKISIRLLEKEDKTNVTAQSEEILLETEQSALWPDKAIPDKEIDSFIHLEKVIVNNLMPYTEIPEHVSSIKALSESVNVLSEKVVNPLMSAKKSEGLPSDKVSSPVLSPPSEKQPSGKTSSTEPLEKALDPTPSEKISLEKAVVPEKTPSESTVFFPPSDVDAGTTPDIEESIRPTSVKKLEGIVSSTVLDELKDPTLDAIITSSIKLDTKNEKDSSQKLQDKVFVKKEKEEVLKTAVSPIKHEIETSVDTTPSTDKSEETIVSSSEKVDEEKPFIFSEDVKNQGDQKVESSAKETKMSKDEKDVDENDKIVKKLFTQTTSHLESKSEQLKKTEERQFTESISEIKHHDVGLKSVDEKVQQEISISTSDKVSKVMSDESYSSMESKVESHEDISRTKVTNELSSLSSSHTQMSEEYKSHTVKKRSTDREKLKDSSDILSSISTVDSGLDRDSFILQGSSEDVSKEVSLEEKYSYESAEKDKPVKIFSDADTLQSISSSRLNKLTDETCSSTLKEIDILKTIPGSTRTELGSPKDEIPLSEASDSGVHSIPLDIDSFLSKGEGLTDIKDDAVQFMESIHKAFNDESVQQGIKTEGMESLIVYSDMERVSTPPTVPVSPLPKTPSSFQDIKVSEGVQSEITYDKSDGSEETITKVVHVGEDVLTQKISTSTEKVPKTIKDSSSDDGDSDLLSLMQNMGKIKTETDTVTKIIKEGENVVTQTITTVTTKEVISREDGTPQNIKTTIETTTLSKGSDGSTITTTDTQTLLSECSSSLKSTSQMDLYAKDSRIDKLYLESDKSETETSSQTKETRKDESSITTDQSAQIQYISETEESDDDVETTTIDTDVSKKIIRENNVDIMETVTTVTKKETLKVDDTKKLRTTVETTVTKERPDGSKDVQRNVEVITEDPQDDSSNIDQILNDLNILGEPEEIESTRTEEIKQEKITIKRVITTRTIKTTYADSQGNPKKLKTVVTVTTTDNYPDGSSQTKVDGSTSITNIEAAEVIESPELVGFTTEDKSVEVEKQQKTIMRNEKSVLQVITTTTTKEILSSKENSKKKLRTITEIVTETQLSDGVTEVTKDVKISLTDFGVEVAEVESHEYEQVGKPLEDITTAVETVTENGITIKRKTTVTTIKEEFHHRINNIKRVKTTVLNRIEDEHPDGSIITKTSEKVSIAEENLHEAHVQKIMSPYENGIKDDAVDDEKISLVLKDLKPEGEPDESETTETEEIKDKDITIKRTIITRVIKIKYCDKNGALKKLKTVTTITTTDKYPDGSAKTTIDTNTAISDIQIDIQTDELKEFTKLEDKSVDVDKIEKIVIREGKEVNQIVTTTTTKEILLSSDGSKKKIKTTIEIITETKLLNGTTEVTKDVRVSVADYGTETLDENLGGYTQIGKPDEHTSSVTEEVTENGIFIIRKTTVTTVRQEYENIETRSKKIKTTVRTIVEDEHPDGTVITKKSEKVSIADVFLKTPLSVQDDSELPETYIDDSETVEDTTEESDVKNEIIKQGSSIINRTITTKTKKETLASTDKNIKRVRTTVETLTVDEYPDGSTETTKDVKITLSEFQKTSDSDLQAALQGLNSTGKVKSSVDKKTNIITEQGRKITQTVTTYVTKEELKNNETNEIAVKTVTETLTENAQEDGSVETTKDVRTQITYLPVGTGLDDWTPEELEEIEKQPTTEHKPNLEELPLTQKEDLKPENKPKKQRSPVGEVTTETETFTKVVKEGDNEITQTITVVTTKEVISPEKIKVTEETTTVSKGSDGVTKTTKSTKTTISEFKEEYEEIIDRGESEKSFSKLSSKTGEMRSSSAASDDLDHPGISSPPSDISSRGSRAATHVWGTTESSGMYYSDDDGPGSPSSTKSQVAHSPRSNLSFELDTKQQDTTDPMTTSFFGQLPEDDSHTSSSHSEVKTEVHSIKKPISKLTEDFLSHEKLRSELSQRITKSDATFLREADEHFEKAIEEHKKVSGSAVISNITAKYELDEQSHSSVRQTTSSKEETITLKDLKGEVKKTETSSASSSSKQESKSERREVTTETSKAKDPIESWGKPLGLPSPIMPPTDGKSTPKKQSTLLNKNKLNQERSKEAKSRVSESPSKKKTPAPVYMELTYVPHHGNSYYSAMEFFKRVRARYYVFSGTEPSKEIYNALLDAKKTWDDKDLEVTIIPTYDTDVLGYWVTENEEALEKYKIDLSPSASRCTINLQDHETSCAAYRLEF